MSMVGRMVKWTSGKGEVIAEVLFEVGNYYRVRIMATTSTRRTATRVGGEQLILKKLCKLA